MTQLCCLVQTFFVALLTKFQSLSKSSGANKALSSGANTALSSGANTVQYCDPLILNGNRCISLTCSIKVWVNVVGLYS